ncbi:MAG: hypothetical protein JW981_08375, partial [Anaerolineae bacterium]|nr:hypothetical protein [Anaerolineae bacterium]
MTWKRVWGPVGVVLVGKADVFYLTKGTNLSPTGDIYACRGSGCVRVGGPGKGFVLAQIDETGERLVGLAPDGSGVWLLQPRHNTSLESFEPSWVQIRDFTGTIFGGGAGLFATDPKNGDIYAYAGAPFAWTRIGSRGDAFAVGAHTLYGLAPADEPEAQRGVYRWLGVPGEWQQIGRHARNIYAGGEALYAVDPDKGDIYKYNGTPFDWTRVGGPGQMFAVDDWGTLYGLSGPGSTAHTAGVYRWRGAPGQWEKIGDLAHQI